MLRETLCETVAGALTPDVMAEILVRLADAYAAHDMNESRVDVLLSPEDRDAVGAIVMEKYRELVRQGLTLRPDERVEDGFKVSFVDYNLYHDFTRGGARRGAGAGAQASPVRHRPACRRGAGLTWSTCTWSRACRRWSSRPHPASPPPSCCPLPRASCGRTTGRTSARCSRTGRTTSARRSCGRTSTPRRSCATRVARLRAARAGAAYDAGAHPFAGYDARCASAAERAMELEDPRERELALDRLRWTLLDELAVAPPFGFQAVLAYGLKLRLAEKWAAMDEAEGLRVAAAVADAALAGSLSTAERSAPAASWA